MDIKEYPKLKDFVIRHQEETLLLLKELAAIGAPTFQEDQRAIFCLEWLKRQGAENAYIDEAGNVIFPFRCSSGRPIAAFLAHMDVVFPEKGQIPVKEEGRYLKAPGIGDDTANLVNLLMCVKYLLMDPPKDTKYGLLFAANACEEGLGDLKGSKTIFQQHPDIAEMISFDLYLGDLFQTAVGSHRCRIEVQTRGGHSFHDFGRENAIQILSGIVQELYGQPLPKTGTTTYNVGRFEGGTSVNTIPQSASMYYEFRSDQKDSLQTMEQQLYEILESHRSSEVEIDTTLLGIRPCSSEDLPQDKMKDLIRRQSGLIQHYTGQPAHIQSGSTDANVPLSLGIPAVTLGTVAGGGAHTYEEWIEKKSMVVGQQLALATILQYCETT